MRTPPGGLRPALIALSATLAVLLSAPTVAHAANRPTLSAPTVAHAANRPTLHVGDADPRVCSSKWMTSGPRSHRPNVFTIRGTYTRPLKPDCNYAGKAWGSAIVAYKFRLGYPTKLLKPIAGPYFFALLRGAKHRPLLWVALAQRRAKAIQAGPTKLALRIVAFETRQIGTAESCCNVGTRKGPGGYSVNDIQAFFHLRALQWCAIFQRFAFVHNGTDFASGYNPYFVPDIGRWAKVRGYLSARARVGSLVAFLSGPNVLDGKHVGLVSSISAKGYFTIEGNSGDAVRQHWYPWGSALRVFINVPSVA